MARRSRNAITIDRSLSQFRLASRQLFNQFFRTDEPWDSSDAAFDLEERFSIVEEVLFEQIMAQSALPIVRYKEVQPSIRVELQPHGEQVPIMLHRELRSGYWDYPLKQATREPVLLFVAFFDWDVLNHRDNQYVMSEVRDWPSHPETVGKPALIEARHVRFGALVAKR